MITNDSRYTRENKSRIATVKSGFKKKKKKTLHEQIELKFMEETVKVLHLEHNIVW
jgi:hypothetical protein